MDVENKPRKIRIVEGTPLEVEALVHELSGAYPQVTFNFLVTDAGIRVVAVLIHESVIRQMQIAMGGPPHGRGH